MHADPQRCFRSISLLLAGLIAFAASIGSAGAQAVVDSRQALELRRTPVVKVFESARNAVVNIAATQVIEVRSPWDDLFQPFLPPGAGGPVRRYESTSAGSGFVINPLGYIVTNAHVVARTAQRKVIFPDKSEYPAEIVAIDQEKDLAVLRIHANKPLPILALGTSSDLMVGESVVAIGNPLGYQHTCTTGIVSALNRTIAVDNDTNFTGLIQTDASINPGNSGGPLLNILGQLIGINTAIRSDAQNIGFAIPVDELRRVLPEMLDVERRYGIRTGFAVSAQGPATVTAITSDGPARDKLQPGDVIQQLDGKPVANAIDFGLAMLGKRPGQTVALQVIRGHLGKTLLVSITLAQRPKPDGAKLLAGLFGISAQPLDDKMAYALGVRGIGGLQVDKVEANSPAGKIQMQRGDIIIQFARYPASSLDEVGDLLERMKSGDRLSVTVLRIQGRMILRTSAIMTAR